MSDEKKSEGTIVQSPDPKYALKYNTKPFGERVQSRAYEPPEAGTEGTPAQNPQPNYELSYNPNAFGLRNKGRPTPIKIFKYSEDTPEDTRAQNPESNYGLSYTYNQFGLMPSKKNEKPFPKDFDLDSPSPSKEPVSVTPGTR